MNNEKLHVTGHRSSIHKSQLTAVTAPTDDDDRARAVIKTSTSND